MLQNKLRAIKITKSNSVTNYLIKVMQVCEQLAVIGNKTVDAKLVNMALNGFPTSWEPFLKIMFSCENLSNFETLWDDCIQEETRMESKSNDKGGDDNLSLFG
jgi:hypothetical protein